MEINMEMISKAAEVANTILGKIIYKKEISFDCLKGFCSEDCNDCKYAEDYENNFEYFLELLESIDPRIKELSDEQDNLYEESKKIAMSKHVRDFINKFDYLDWNCRVSEVYQNVGIFLGYLLCKHGYRLSDDGIFRKEV